MNPLRQLAKLGQATWLDYLDRPLMTSGRLQHFIEEDGLCGITSNPAIFQKAISGSDEYETDIRHFARQGIEAEDMLEHLCVADVQSAADIFQPVFERTNGKHGFVSLEVNPHLAYEAEETVQEGRRLWRALSRPNVFIKVPATRPGLKAIRQLVGEGININVTLLFGLPRYREVAESYLGGLEDRVARGESIDRVRSVASFFLSRIDVLVDPMLDKVAESGGSTSDTAKSLRGNIAIACARVAYQIYQKVRETPRWRDLEKRGAIPQWLLWASTGTKDPEYSDVKYVESLIGPETVNTMPLKTLEAFRDHGRARESLEQSVDEAKRRLDQLDEVGIDLADVAQQLEAEGVEKFNRPFDSLLERLRMNIAWARRAKFAGATR